jgi:tight adherence protein C
VIGRRAQGRASAHDLADFADLLRVALGSGFTVLRAIALVCAHSTTPVADAFTAVLDPPGDRSPVDVLAALPERLGDHGRELCAALVAAARYGAPVLPALERVAFELRLARRLDAEVRAKRTSIVLLLPLVSCVLPAFVLLAIVPLVLGSLAALPGSTP